MVRPNPKKKKVKKKKKKAGRKSSYKPSYCKKLIAYFDRDPYEEREIPHYKDGKQTWTDYKRMPNDLPTLRGFAKEVGHSSSSVYRWLEKYPAFRDAFTHAQELRKWMLIQNGLQGLYTPAFAIFTAKNVTDMKDEETHKHEGEITFALALKKAMEEPV